MRPRTLLITPALAVLGTGAALAAGILLTGTPAGPKVAPTPTAGYGAAKPATATLLPLHVADPAGGLPWGLRTVRTSRDDVCLQVGRLADGNDRRAGRRRIIWQRSTLSPLRRQLPGPAELRAPGRARPRLHQHDHVGTADKRDGGRRVSC